MDRSPTPILETLADHPIDYTSIALPLRLIAASETLADHASETQAFVRLCVLHIRSVQVRFRVTSSSVVEGNCVTVRWGGEQPEANDQSVG